MQLVWGVMSALPTQVGLLDLRVHPEEGEGVPTNQLMG